MAQESKTLEAIVEIGFKPSRHGFRFRNWYPEHIINALCGGMCFAAMDYYLAEKEIPQQDDVPQQDTPLYLYLVSRQMNSFGRLGRGVAKLLHWMSLPDERLQQKTYGEFTDVLASLDRGQAVNLYLVYNTARDGFNPTKNHQVLAYGYSISEHSTRILIYDPNHPCDDECFIQVSEARDDNGKPGVSCIQSSGEKCKPVHGLFIMRDYKQAKILDSFS